MNTGYLLSELASKLNVTFHGEDVFITQVASLENAGPTDIAFFNEERYKNQLEASNASAIIISEKYRHLTGKPCLLCKDPYLGFAKVARLLNPSVPAHPSIHQYADISTTAKLALSAEISAFVTIGERAKIGERVIIHPGCHIADDVEIGDDSILYPRVTVYAHCLLGKRVIVQAGASIGSDGFGNVKESGEWLSIPQLGRVVIEDDVHIGANTTIDRGTLDDTIIRQGARLDNQIQIAHNVVIGCHTAIAACVGIAGGTKIGAHCMVGGAVSINGHIDIVDNVVILGATSIIGSIRKPGVYGGPYPMQTHKEWLQNAAQIRRLKNLYNRIKKLEKPNAQDNSQ